MAVGRLSLSILAFATSVTPALAQMGGTPILPSEGFLRSPQQQNAAPPAANVGRVDASEPTYDETIFTRIDRALLSYSAIAAHGGWPTLPKDAKLAAGVSGPEVALLRRRLALTGDLDSTVQNGEAYDAGVVAAVKRFQARHGLTETGSVGPLTLTALNVPVEARLRQLTGSRERLTGTNFIFGQRYVVVNIPAATVEAIADGKVERRHVAVVGKPERPSPTLTTTIRAINLNPTWTVPLSIVKKDIVPKMRKDPTYLARMHMRLLDASGNEISPSTVDWHAERTPGVTIRQDSGTWNSLGAVRIDMPNPHSVYLHDTSQKNLFNSDVRFHSSGCARVENPRDLAAWLLQDNEGWGRREIDAGIATGERRDIRLPRPVPVAWIYLTGWSTHDGTVHFRPDIYGHDEAPVKPFMVSQPRPIITAAQASGFVLQSGESRPARIQDVSWLDSQ